MQNLSEYNAHKKGVEFAFKGEKRTFLKHRTGEDFFPPELDDIISLIEDQRWQEIKAILPKDSAIYSTGRFVFGSPTSKKHCNLIAENKNWRVFVVGQNAIRAFENVFPCHDYTSDLVTWFEPK